MDDGSVYNLASCIYSSGPHHCIVKFPPKDEKSSNMFEKASIVAAIPARWPFHPSYMHTFGITENYFIIVEQPLSISLAGIIAARLKNEPLAGSFRWYQNEKTQINLVSRKTGKLTHKFFSDAFFFLHIINQYEISDYLVLDICTYHDPAMLECMYVDTMKGMQYNEKYAEMFRSTPARFVLPLNPNQESTNLIKLEESLAEAYCLTNGEIVVKPERLCNLGCETPRINYEQYLGKQYRFFYAINADVDAEIPGTIIKVDLKNKNVKTWSLKNCYPSEPIFVPRPECKFEDDGIVLAAMVWGGNDTNHVGLLILDAERFEEIGRAEFKTPGPVPKCLHGWFLPRKK